MNRLLIIEDDVSIAELERDYLEINGFMADIETTGDQGLTKAINEEYSLIILDIMLPGKDGFELCKKIRASKDIPILLVTAKKEDIDKIRGLGLGADDFIVKPFSPGELVARVKAHLARYERFLGRDRNKEELRLRGLTIEKNTRRVWMNEKEISLTTKEFDLLLFLASHPDHVFSKDHLFDRIWGLDSIGDITTVTVHIRKLREKIEADPSTPQYIETVWGAGYRFKA
ncbi:response regulator transcription factor [Pseudalkalibacillus salsuginis]|uniref:response regulator transcription factor n=1 Tax=Pseudalkalibacillus salsuginis TaxID=2910972 RepID=UPI001F1B34DD|nr:response regulator transcription factor [Pseudalkalibacillus salsuginis]MCF6409435.1 response regulator transcription factor [Pseudalkalibacillus salsuginis]